MVAKTKASTTFHCRLATNKIVEDEKRHSSHVISHKNFTCYNIIIVLYTFIISTKINEPTEYKLLSLTCKVHTKTVQTICITKLISVHPHPQ